MLGRTASSDWARQLAGRVPQPATWLICACLAPTKQAVATFAAARAAVHASC